MDFKDLAKNIKEMVALDGGTHRLEDLNRELASCNIQVTYSHGELDYDNPENTSPVDALIGSMK